MDLEPYHRFPTGPRPRPAHVWPRPAGASVSSTRATWNMMGSPRAGARTWTPIGRPSSPVPNGTLTAGWPARLEGIVHTSLRYIVSGSEVLAPSGNAVVGDVGESNTSKDR